MFTFELINLCRACVCLLTIELLNWTDAQTLMVLISNCSHAKKRDKQLKKNLQRGLLDPEKVDAFRLFQETGGIQYCLYRESERILGNTFGMCVLQVAF